MSVISETVNGLSMADAFRYYRDELNWQVYPVDGPWVEKRSGQETLAITELVEV